MKTLLFILASALAFGQTALINGSSAKFRNVTGTAAPSSGTCDASSEVGSFYVRTGNQASVPTQVYVCKQTGSSTYAWGPFFGYTQTAAPATCATGELWFDTDATAGSNLNLCTASNTWTAISGGGSGTVSVVSSGALTSTALVTGGGTTTLQTPSSTATLDSSGNLVVSSVSTGSSAPTCTAGTAGLICLKEGTAGTGEASAALLYSKTDHLLYANLNNGGEVQVPTATSTATLTNKTFDTAGTGNSLKINGTAITAVSGTGAVCLASGSSCGGASSYFPQYTCLDNSTGWSDYNYGTQMTITALPNTAGSNCGIWAQQEGSDYVRARVKSTGSSTFNVKYALRIGTMIGDNAEAGVLVKDSGTQSVVCGLRLSSGSNRFIWRGDRYTDTSTTSAAETINADWTAGGAQYAIAYNSSNAYFTGQGLIYVELASTNGTTTTCRASFDGVVWIPVWSSTFLTPASTGYYTRSGFSTTDNLYVLGTN